VREHQQIAHAQTAGSHSIGIQQIELVLVQQKISQVQVFVAELCFSELVGRSIEPVGPGGDDWAIARRVIPLR